MKKLIALSAALLITASPINHAQEEGDGVGCGLGSTILAGQDSKAANVLASFINSYLVPNTFFMTTGGGVLGCDPTQTVQNEQATEVFVASNMDQLSSEVARGDGDYLNVLAVLMGIEAKDQAAFKKVTQDNFDQLFLGNGNAKQVIETIELAMLNDNALAKYAVN